MACDTHTHTHWKPKNGLRSEWHAVKGCAETGPNWTERTWIDLTHLHACDLSKVRCGTECTLINLASMCVPFMSLDEWQKWFSNKLTLHNVSLASSHVQLCSLAEDELIKESLIRLFVVRRSQYWSEENVHFYCIQVIPNCLAVKCVIQSAYRR